MTYPTEVLKAERVNLTRLLETKIKAKCQTNPEEIWAKLLGALKAGVQEAASSSSSISPWLEEKRKEHLKKWNDAENKIIITTNESLKLKKLATKINQNLNTSPKPVVGSVETQTTGAVPSVVDLGPFFEDLGELDETTATPSNTTSTIKTFDELLIEYQGHEKLLKAALSYSNSERGDEKDIMEKVLKTINPGIIGATFKYNNKTISKIFGMKMSNLEETNFFKLDMSVPGQKDLMRKIKQNIKVIDIAPSHITGALVEITSSYDKNLGEDLKAYNTDKDKFMADLRKKQNN